ncbi:MAG: VTT domain-containing protein [Phycisphaerae bacterium]|nr:VTT domain-containing protein [Phycisphaerae bacterium]
MTMTTTPEQLVDAEALTAVYRKVTLRVWFVFYLAVLLTAAATLAILLRREPVSLGSWEAFKESVKTASPAVKLLVFGIYMMLSCTFLPLNTSWITAAVAMEQYAVTGELWTTVLAVSVVGATASTMANLNDYHVFTLLLRHHRVARVRHLRMYQSAVGWFEKAPFLLLFIFNLLPIPIDVTRMLAATHRYSRWPFAAANFLGRWIRYGIIAYVTYSLADKGYVAVLVLLGLAFVMAMGRVMTEILRRMRSNEKHELSS